jgi:hypothetical protein
VALFFVAFVISLHYKSNNKQKNLWSMKLIYFFTFDIYFILYIGSLLVAKNTWCSSQTAFSKHVTSLEID